MKNNHQSSSLGRPTSSLISKKTGLPQVFLEKYKKQAAMSGCGALISANAGDHHGLSTGKVYGNMGDTNMFSPNPMDPLQNRYLSSAECILNHR
jgi:hypothetical protein